MQPSPNLLPAVSARSIRHGGRSYFVDERGCRLPSVSSILSATKPPEDREALLRWRQRLGDAEARRVAGQASRRGTLTHQYLRHYLLGKDMACPEAARPYWESLEAVMSQLDQVRLVESPVFHYDLGYAGRVDCVASYRGMPCVVDWKTSDRPKGTIERLYDSPIQLAAYCGAVNHAYAEHDIHIREALMVVAIPGQTAETFHIQTDALKEYWQSWQERVALYYRRYG